MDAQQSDQSSLKSTKKKKTNSAVSGQGTERKLDSTSAPPPACATTTASTAQSSSLGPVQSTVDSVSPVVQPDHSGAKKKRNRKRKKQGKADAASSNEVVETTAERQKEASDKEKNKNKALPNTSVNRNKLPEACKGGSLDTEVKFQAKRVESGKPVSGRKDLDASNLELGGKPAGSTQSSRGVKKSKTVLTEGLVSSESLEVVISPGAQRASGETAPWSCSTEKDIKNFFNSFGAQNNKAELAARLLAVGSHLGITSRDAELLTSASHLGPIYSNSSLSSTVSVTCSSSSSQVSSDRLHSSHLYGGSVLSHSSVASDIPTGVSSDSSKIMKTSESTSTSAKSREEIEAERKARKAMKQAKKQGKPNAQPTDSELVKIDAKGVVNSVAEKQPLNDNKSDSKPVTTSSVKPSSSGEPKEILDRMKHLVVTEQISAPDEPDGMIRISRTTKDKDILKEAKAAVPSDKVWSGKVAPSSNLPPKDDVGKSKAELRAERRAKQEAQRAAKASQQEQKVQPMKEPQQKQQQPAKGALETSVCKVQVQSKTTTPKTTKEKVKEASRVKLFSHIQPTYKGSISQSIRVNHPEHHPAIVRLGVQYAERTVLGSNARCVALLHALKEVIRDYKTPPQKEFSRGLEGHLQPNVEFLQRCRPLSVSMNNALRHIKRQMTQLPNNVSDHEARRKLQEAIDLYIHQEIEKAAQAIGITVKDKIIDGDVILVYACSSLVLHAVSVAHKEGRQFRVVVVDSMPWLEGREMLRRLVSLGLQCSYVHISAASFVMRQVTKVLLGAHALLANGYVMSRVGSSQIALLAHTYNVPVLVCCETHKFSERVQTDSFVYNELGNPDELVGLRRTAEREGECERPLKNWRDIPNLSLLNLVYDVTPPDLVTAVVTERAILPCTSVPVILRIKPTEC